MQSSPRTTTSTSTARYVHTVATRPTVNGAKPSLNVSHKSHLPVRRTFNQRKTPKNSDLKEIINTAKVNNITTTGTKAVVSVVQGNRENAVKSLACWIWRPRENVIDHISKDSGSYILKRFNYIDLQGRLNPKGGKISRKGKIRTGKLDFKDVYFVKELKFNLFSISQMCDKKNNVLFTETECLALSLNFKLLDENQVLLKVPKQNNMYSFDLKNIASSGGLTCLFAKATIDESNLWHMRSPNLDFMRPFECPVTILNTLDHLGKFEEKADEGFLVGYSVNSKAFLGRGSKWLFDIDSLKKSMNYEPVTARNQTNDAVGIEINVNAGQAGQEKASDHEYILLSLVPSHSPLSSSIQSSDDKDADGAPGKGDERVSKGSGTDNQESLNINIVGSNDSSMPYLEETGIFDDVYNDREVGTEADTNNLELSTVKIASTPMKPNKALIKDAKDEDVDVHLYISMIRLLMYLTASRPDMMFAVCAYSPFDLEAFSDNDYAGASLDRKSIIGEYVAAASYCGQALWIQNQMLDYGFNLMNTKIYIDNEINADVLDIDSAKVKTVNEDVQIRALVDGKKIIITKASIRRDLQLQDAEDTPILTQPSSSPPQRKHKSKRKQRKETEEQIKTHQAAKIEKLKQRVKNLEGKKKKKRTYRLKRLYKVGLTARVESFEEEKDQGRMNDEDLFRVNDLDDDEVIVDVTAGENVEQDATVAKKEVSAAESVEGITTVTTSQITKDDVTLAQTLMEIKAAKPKTKGVLIQEPTGSESRPPMLNKENYVPWSFRLLWYAKSRPNGKLIHNSILNGPYVRRMIAEPGDGERDVNVNETFHEQTDDKLSERELKQIEADDQAIQTIFFEKIADNLKFLNNLQPEWSRYVTIVHQTKDLHTADYTQLYDFLKYNQKEVYELKAERLAKIQDPLAIMANSNNLYAFPAPHQDQSPFNHDFLQQPMTNPEDITDPTTAMNMALVLMAKAFKLNYSTPTNNNQRISSNPRNRQIAQPGMNMGQDRQMQMIGGNGGNQFRQYAGQNARNLNGYNEVQNVRNQVAQNPRV
nr:ribonuclease H-like domain-containing protein [Tanacetum cinerariifolium]